MEEDYMLASLSFELHFTFFIYIQNIGGIIYDVIKINLVVCLVESMSPDRMRRGRHIATTNILLIGECQIVVSHSDKLMKWSFLFLLDDIQKPRDLAFIIQVITNDFILVSLVVGRKVEIGSMVGDTVRDNQLIHPQEVLITY